MKAEMEQEYDFIVVGSGIAGLYVGLQAKEHFTVLVLTKGRIDECNTKYAQGGIAAPIGRFDSPDLHFRDTVTSGAGICDEAAVHLLVEEAVDRIGDLIQYGLVFDTVDGEISLAREGAHSVARVLHAGGDATGAIIENTLSSLARGPNVSVLENHLVTDVLVEANRALGVRSLDCESGKVKEYFARYVVLAAGGAGQVYRYTSNPDVATGDGVALAFGAGALVSDMEFFQFHPTLLYMPGVPPFLISEAVRGEGGLLRDVSGRRFMQEYHPDAELGPRDVVSRSILSEMERQGVNHVYLDVTHLPAKRVMARFPTIFRFCLDNGLDIARDPIPVAPAAHYLIGGAKTNTWGETSVEKLFACGEMACTGVHGANRLASNSLLEVLVFGKRIVQRALAGEKWDGKVTTDNDLVIPFTEVERARDVTSSSDKISLSRLQKLTWSNIGIIRSSKSLREADLQLDLWNREHTPEMNRSSLELQSTLCTARLITKMALLREESRGVHYRSDFPQESPEWCRHIVFKGSTAQQ